MSDKRRAETLTAYRAYAEHAAADPSAKIESFFGGELYKQLRERSGLFQGHQDLALFLTTDAVKVFKSRIEFKCQPIAAVSLSLSLSLSRSCRSCRSRSCRERTC